MNKSTIEKTPLCPSARTESANSIIYGIVGGTVTKPRVIYLKQPQPFTDKLLARISPITPTEVFRIAAPCAASNCQHFDGKDCSLVERVVEKLPMVVQELLYCSIRRDCQWWQQSGKVACLRCPQVITDNYNPSELMREVAKPIAI